LALFRSSQPSVQLYGSGNQSIKHNGRTRENRAVLLVAARPTDTDTRLAADRRLSFKLLHLHLLADGVRHGGSGALGALSSVPSALNLVFITGRLHFSL
jgi:hypothetical protein